MKSDRYRKGVPPAFSESAPKYIQDELTKIERVLDRTFDDVTQVNADGTTLKASIETERTLRVTADEALAQIVTTLTATVDTNKSAAAAAVVTEQTARATADTALAQSITTLTATVSTNKGDAAASLTAEQTARATADTAIAQTVTTLTATVNTNKTDAAAAVTAEQTARATADTAIAQTVTNLTATVNTNKGDATTALSAAISAEQTARANGDTAVAQTVTNLSAAYEANKGAVTTAINAAVASEASARVTKDDAIALSVTNLTATVNGNNTAVNARVDSEASARASKDTAIAQTVTDLTASLNGVNGALDARITNEANARVSGDQANASLINTLTTTVNGNTASISTQAQSINGIAARWGVKVNNNNRVAGIMLNSDSNGISSFDIEANYLNLYIPGTNTRAIYWDGAELVVRGNIRATSITADAVNILGNNAVNRPVIGNPTIVAQGNWPTSQGAYGTQGFVEYIDTGIDVDSSWTTASTQQYLATATIAAGTSQNGGQFGYSEAQVVVGDGLGTSTSPYARDNRIYIKYSYIAFGGGSGSFGATSISWKLARL